MKNKQEILGLVANISLVVFIFCFIVAGLNLIGIYSLPKPIEKLLGTYEENEPPLFGDSGVMQDFADFDENSEGFEQVKLGYENAKQILSSLDASGNYSQRITVVNSFENIKRTEHFDVIRNNGLYTVDVYDENLVLVRSIKENTDNTVSVSEVSGSDGKAVSVNKGNFSISDECGFVLTADEFLDSDYELSEAEFSMFDIDDAYYVSIEFDYNNMRQKYVISLDFGVVTEVYSYSEGKPVYEMTTQSLDE